jgi:hypothetical protein
MFIVLLDEPGLFVFDSPETAARQIEPPDAESEVRAAFDDGAIPYRVEWIHPNQRKAITSSIGSIEFGEYHFVPSGQADRIALIELLERHSDYPDPADRKADLDALLQKMRAVQ